MVDKNDEKHDRTFGLLDKLLNEGVIKMYEYHNKRFPQMWQIISSEIDFTNTIVIDAGCGYGDFAVTVAQSGAKAVYAIDNNADLTARLALEYTGKLNNLYPTQDDINSWNLNSYPKNDNSKFDILSCFSVLPYLDNPTEILRLFKIMARVVLIECQYTSDGPGFEHIKHNGDMLKWLKMCGYNQVGNLGRTLVEGRNKWRTIWRCS